MVFTKLSAQEKEAFFGLLDEYFESRPELLSGGGGQSGGGGIAGTGVSTAAAASVVQRALAAGGGASAGTGKSTNPFSASMNQGGNGNGNGHGRGNVDVAQAVSLGRVAAASLAFSGGGGGQPHPQFQSQSQSQLQNPPSLPRRGVADRPLSVASERPGAGTMGIPGVEVDKLVTKKASVFSALKKNESAGVAIPSAFAPPKNAFGPPPVRRATSDTNANANVGASTNAGTRLAQRRVMPPPPPTSEPEQEPETAEGEWAEVLYDYSSEDPGDLAVEAGTRVFVTDRTSEDWWTGQVEGRGRQGLFPASYVKLL